MANIYLSLVKAITDHWKAHDNKYPLKIMLTPDQLNTLNESRRIGRIALGDDRPVTDSDFMGVRLEQDASTPGVLIAVDGSEIAVGAA